MHHSHGEALKLPQRLHRWQVLLAHLYNQGDSAVVVAVTVPRSASAGVMTDTKGAVRFLNPPHHVDW